MHTHDGPSANACQSPKYKHEVSIFHHPHADAPEGTPLDYSDEMPEDCFVCCKPLSIIAGPRSVGAIGLVKFDPASTDVKAGCMALCNSCYTADTVKADVAAAVKRDLLGDAAWMLLDTMH